MYEKNPAAEMKYFPWMGKPDASISYRTNEAFCMKNGDERNIPQVMALWSCIPHLCDGRLIPKKN